MTQRNIQHIVVWAATILFLVFSTHAGPFSRNPAYTICTILAYLLFLTALTLGIKFLTNKEDRTTPVIPTGFFGIKIGPISDDMTKFLANARLLKSRAGKSGIHELYEISESFPNGRWICNIETSDKRIIATRHYFRSDRSFLFDSNPLQQGTGRFLPDQRKTSIS